MISADELQERLAALQADGAAIQTALSGMENSLNAWFDAMSGVHDVLARAATQADRGRRSLVTVSSPAPVEGVAPEKSPARLATSVPAMPPATTPAAEPEPAELSATEEEEKALLDSLDAETARQVHVRRRLSGHSKSVRELVDEIRAEKKGGAPSADRQQQQQQPKKGWWG